MQPGRAVEHRAHADQHRGAFGEMIQPRRQVLGVQQEKDEN